MGDAAQGHPGSMAQLWKYMKSEGDAEQARLAAEMAAVSQANYEDAQAAIQDSEDAKQREVERLSEAATAAAAEKELADKYAADTSKHSTFFDRGGDFRHVPPWPCWGVSPGELLLPPCFSQPRIPVSLRLE